ncbi:MAG TPA: ScyD/ScyE family protein, partial [Thermomicrobiales bacterium]
MFIGCVRRHIRYRRSTRTVTTVATILALFASFGVAAQAPPGPPAGGPGGPPPPPSANVSVFATGVESPRGLRFGPDGNLYVAEGGLTPTNPTSTVGTCDQVPPPVGPYMGGKTARISKVSPGGVVTTVVSGLPSSRDAMGAASAMEGVADVEFIGTTLYGLIAGGGCSHGVADGPNTIIRVNADGSWTPGPDLGAFEKAHPVAKPEADDFEPDGTWYSMVNVGGALYAIEPNHGELDKITTDGQISRVVDISASQGHIVPTAVAYHNGNFYVGNLGTFPIVG